MRGSPGTRRIRADRVVLVVAAIAVAALGLFFVQRVQAQQTDAQSTTYPQVTQPPPVVAVPAVTFVGDSYSAGTGSTGFDNRFTTLVAAYEGWDLQNLAYGGTGYLRAETENSRTGCGQDSCPNYLDVLPSVIDAEPNIVVVSGGRNDIGLPEADVEQAIDDFYSRLRDNLPDAQIVATSPVWAWSAPPNQLEQIQAAVKAAVARAGGIYLDIGEPLVDDRSLVADDRVHPNDAGHAELARLIEVALSQSEASDEPAPSVAASSTSP